MGGQDHAAIERIIRDNGIQTVRLEFTDFHGITRGKAVSAANFMRVVEEGLQFALPTFALDLAGNVAVGTGVAEEMEYCDMTAIPDITTFQLLPWQPRTAKVIGDLYLKGKPLAVSPRNVLKRVVEKYRQAGLEPVTASELEFFVLRKGEVGWVPYADKPSMVYTMNPLVDGQNLIGNLRGAMDAMGVPVSACNHEFFPSQYEINLPHRGAVEMADLTATFKQMVKEMAGEQGLLATFMARPLANSGGNGFHLHVSCRDANTGKNLFYDPAAEHGLSETARHFVGGQLKHAEAMMAVLGPTVNSYKRYKLNSFAPYYVVWGLDNRTTYVRIPPERGKGTRVENRAGDGGANPYLVAAAVLAAGLDGILNKVDPGPPYKGDAYAIADPTGVRVVPLSLETALDRFEADSFVDEVFGAEFVRAYAAVKRLEVERFKDHVTDWEFGEYSFYL